MKLQVYASILAAAAVLGVDADGTYKFKPVTTIHTRFVGDTPIYNTTTKTWSTKFPLSSANTASLLGGLQYPQAEVLAEEYIVNCERRYNGTYIIFYEFEIAQPPAAMAFYDGQNTLKEYGKYAAFDGGMCTKDQPWCTELWNGSYDGQADNTFGDWSNSGKALDKHYALGNYVGGYAYGQAGDNRAPYPMNYWFSIPGECSWNGFKNKSKDCTKNFPGGKCKGAYGTPEGTPDGVKCTWNYQMLGYVDINDLVGMYDVVSPTTGQKYSSKNPITAYKQFCMDKGNEYGGVYFKWEKLSDGTYNQTGGFPFWANPSDPEANKARAKALVEHFNNATNPLTQNNIPVKSSEELRKLNPKCYENVKACSTSPCWRDDQMLCQACSSSTPTGLCESIPQGFTFASYPTLTYPTPAAETSSPDSDTSSGPTTSKKNGSGSSSPSTSTSGASLSASSIFATFALATLSVAASIAC